MRLARFDRLVAGARLRRRIFHGNRPTLDRLTAHVAVSEEAHRHAGIPVGGGKKNAATFQPAVGTAVRGHEHVAVAGGRVAGGSSVAQAISALESSLEALALAEEAIRQDVVERLGARSASGSSSSGAAPHAAEEVGSDVDVCSGACAASVDPMEVWSDLLRDQDQPLPHERVVSVLTAAEHLLSTRHRSAVVDLQVPRELGARLVILGDTHGQLADVLLVLHQYGPPSPTNVYLVVGDICDRGDRAVEIWAVLLAFMLRCPGSVWILRGNHENSGMNGRPRRYGGGFVEECTERYAGAQGLYQQFERIFRHLPLFAVVDREVFVVHGGLFRTPGVTLEQLRALDFKVGCPTTRTREQIKQGIPLNWSQEDAILFDAQWADPHDGTGLTQGARGFDTIKFGTDVTRRFLDENGLRCCIRGHETPKNAHGFLWAHEGRLLTVFTASNYTGRMGNLGAVALLEHRSEKGLTINPVEHMAPGLDELSEAISNDLLAKSTSLSKVRSFITDGLQRAGVYTFMARHASPAPPCEHASCSAAMVPEAMLSHLRGVICAYREEIWAFGRRQAKAPGRVCADELAKELAALALAPEDGSASWRRILADSLCVVDADGRVDYEALLARFQVVWDTLPGDANAMQMQNVVDAILQAELTLPETIALFDKDLNDSIDLYECGSVLRKLLPLLTSRQVHHMLEALQASWGGGHEVSVEHFLVALASEFAVQRKPPQAWMLPTLERLVVCLAPDARDRWTLGERLVQQYHLWDTDKDGLLSREELMQAITPGMSGVTGGELEALMDYMDGNQSGTVSIFELLRAFVQAAPPEGGRGLRTGGVTVDLPADTAGTLFALLHLHRSTLLHGCRALDAGGAGTLSRGDFLAVVAALLHALRAAHSQMKGVARWPESRVTEDLLRALPDEQPVCYGELLAGLRVEDRGPAPSSANS